MEDLFNIDTQEQVAVHMCGFDGVWRGNYFEGKLISRMEAEVKVRKFKNGKASGNDDIIRMMSKGGSNRVADRIGIPCIIWP